MSSILILLGEVLVCMSVVCFCAVMIITRMRRPKFMSERTRGLQAQLFRALVLQVRVILEALW